MVFEFGYRKVSSNRMLVMVYPNTFNERKEVLPDLIGNLMKRLDETIPFEFNTVIFKPKQLTNKKMLGYWCLEKIIEFKIPSEEAIELLKRNKFQSKIPL